MADVRDRAAQQRQRPARQRAGRARRGRRGCRRPGDVVADRREDQHRPRASVTRPARALVPRSGCRSWPGPSREPGGAVEAVASEPSNAATGRPVTTGAQLGVVGRGRRAGGRRPASPASSRSCAGEPAAVVDRGAVQVDPEAAAAPGGRPRRRRRTSRRRSRRAPVWRASTSAPSLSLTCSTRSTMSASGTLVTGPPRGRARGRRRARGRGPATRTPSRAQERREVGRRHRGGVGLAAVRRRPRALVGPQRGDRGDHRRRGRRLAGQCGLTVGPGEQRGVVAERDPVPPGAVQARAVSRGERLRGRRRARLAALRRRARRPGTGRRRRRARPRRAGRRRRPGWRTGGRGRAPRARPWR